MILIIFLTLVLYKLDFFKKKNRDRKCERKLKEGKEEGKGRGEKEGRTY